MGSLYGRVARSRRRSPFPAFLVLLLSAGPRAGEAGDAFALPTPAGWRGESIPFPLPFAPELAYRGVEELRLQKGVFDPGSPGYFHYVFLWWLQGAPAFDRDRLRDDLGAYYRGLLQIKAEEIAVEVVDARPGEDDCQEGARRFDAVVRAAFRGRPLKLHLEVTLDPCAADGLTSVFFCVSPRPRTDASWGALRALRAGLKCRAG